MTLAVAFSSEPADADVSRPELTFSDPAVQSTLGSAYTKALTNLLDVNTVSYDPDVYNSTGFLTDPPGKFIRAGGEYDTPWTRDASVNSWNAASLLEPEVARNTLWSVAKRESQGLILDQDNQWWDQVVWVTAAWNHYLVTGDQTFLSNAYDAAKNTLHTRIRLNYNASEGLFQGPAFFNDGIAGYPAPPADATESKGSFVLDYPGTDRLMVLSTNALHYQAHRSAALMASTLNKAADEVAAWNSMADSLKAKINEKFWIPNKGLYGYLIHDGTLDESEEGTGLSFSILFGIADAAKTASILQNAHIQPYGIVVVYPHFPRYDDAHPGRHNAIVWPMIQGFWAHAAAQSRNQEVFAREVSSLAKLANASEKFYEIYNAQTGEVDGGWQTGGSWGSVPDQTWSATAYLRMIYNGLFGMSFTPSSLNFAPLLPVDWGDVSLTGIKYRGMTLDVDLTGSGSAIASFKLDGTLTTEHSVPDSLTGAHKVEIALGDTGAGAGGSGGMGSTGGTGGTGAATGTGGTATTGAGSAGSSDSGCAFKLDSSPSSSRLVALSSLLAVLSVLLRRRQRQAAN